jgi:hypothetical protein
MKLGSQYEFATRKEAPEHIVTYRAGPLYRMAFCSCGWRGQVPRGNALGQSSKLRGQVNRHIKAAQIED